MSQVGEQPGVLASISGTPLKRGFLSAAAPSAYLVSGVLLADVHQVAGLQIHAWLPLVQALIAISALTGAWLLDLSPRVGGVMVAVSLLLMTGTGVAARYTSPQIFLALFILSVAILAWIWPVVRKTGGESTTPELTRRVLLVRGAAGGALLTWVLAVPLELASDAGGVLCPFVSMAVLGAYMVGLPLRSSPVWRVPWWLALPLGLLGVVVSLASLGSPFIAALWLPSLPAMVLIALRRPPSAMLHTSWEWWEGIVDQPARLLAFTFLATCLAGGLLLAMPSASSRAGQVSLVDALFTSFSATCVTGLIVVDTPHAFSWLGQGVILLLIQIGGLGIMTFSTAAMVTMRKRLSMRYEGAMSEIMGSRGRSELTDALVRMLVLTAAVEVVGTALLTAQFAAGSDGAGRAVWRGLFTAVSAYCNAGFALQTDSLVPYNSSPGVLAVVSLLIIVGGLGPVVITAIPALVGKGRPSLHARLVLVTSGILLAAGTVLFLSLEWSRTMEGMSLVDRITNAWFMSVTTRTAGFNSVDVASMHPASITMAEILMFIGGSPGSTAGGIKTTTVAVLVLAVIAALRGRKKIASAGYNIPHSTVYRAMAVAVLGFVLFALALLALQLTQSMTFTQAVFESLSALGTVGLSVGGTEHLDSVGKVIVMIVMFAGRVGPLTLFLVLGERRSHDRWDYPEQEIPTG